MRTHRITALVALILATAAGSVGAEAGEPGFYITDEIFVIPGRTQEAALIAEIGSAEGLSFPTKASLEDYARTRTQQLENTRTFSKTTITVDYPSTMTGDGPIPVTLTVTIEDGTKFLPIPYAFYNSNDGFLSGVVANVPNLGGTLQDLVFVTLYAAPPDENDNLRWTDPNFMLLGAWNGIRVGKQKLALMGTVMRMNREIEDRGVIKVEYQEFTLIGAAELTRPVTDSLDAIVEANVGGSPSNSDIRVQDDAYLMYGPLDFFWSAGYGAKLDKVDWIGNFRNGYKGNAKAKYTAFWPSEADAAGEIRIEADFSGYYAVNRRINPSFRLAAFAKTGDPDLEAGSLTRGMRDGSLKGQAGVFANTTLQTLLARAGHTEFHFSPLVDFAWTWSPDDDEYVYDWGFTAGGEFITLFDSIKSLPIKIAYSYDLRPESRIHNGNPYEFEFSFSFAY